MWAGLGGSIRGDGGGGGGGYRAGLVSVGIAAQCGKELREGGREATAGSIGHSLQANAHARVHGSHALYKHPRGFRYTGSYRLALSGGGACPLGDDGWGRGSGTG